MKAKRNFFFSENSSYRGSTMHIFPSFEFHFIGKHILQNNALLFVLTADTTFTVFGEWLRANDSCLEGRWRGNGEDKDRKLERRDRSFGKNDRRKWKRIYISWVMRREKSLNKVRSARRKCRILRVRVRMRVRMRASLLTSYVPSFDSFVWGLFFFVEFYSFSFLVH